MIPSRALRAGGHNRDIAQLINEMTEGDTVGFADGMRAAVFF